MTLKIAFDMRPVAEQLRGAAAAMMDAAEKIDPQKGIRTAHHCEHSPVDYCWDCREKAKSKPHNIAMHETKSDRPKPDPQYYLEYHLYAHPIHEPTLLLDSGEPGNPTPEIGEIVTRHGRTNDFKQRRFVPAEDMAKKLRRAMVESNNQTFTIIRELIEELEKPPRYDRDDG